MQHSRTHPVLLRFDDAPSARPDTTQLQLLVVESAAMDSPLLPDFAAFSNGEWAGWCCEFSAMDGRQLPVPERLVPPEMLDWGLAPAGMEVLVSELVGSTHRRRQLQVVPEIG